MAASSSQRKGGPGFEHCLQKTALQCRSLADAPIERLHVDAGIPREHTQHCVRTTFMAAVRGETDSPGIQCMPEVVEPLAVPASSPLPTPHGTWPPNMEPGPWVTHVSQRSPEMGDGGGLAKTVAKGTDCLAAPLTVEMSNFAVVTPPALAHVPAAAASVTAGTGNARAHHAPHARTPCAPTLVGTYPPRYLAETQWG